MLSTQFSFQFVSLTSLLCHDFSGMVLGHVVSVTAVGLELKVLSKQASRHPRQ